MDPFNISLLVLNKNHLSRLGEVTSLSIFEPTSDNFDPNGLFSSEIFGTIGSNDRNSLYGYIDMHIKVLHPLVYKNLIDLKAFYKDILSSKKYATFDKELGDFVTSDINEGFTGYHFFMKHLKFLKLHDNDSDARAAKIKMVELYSGTESQLDKWVVLPAGLRDYAIDKNGVPSEDEVNGLYRKLLNTAGLLKNTTIDYIDPSALDSVRFKLQNITLELYEYFRVMLDGKHKFILGKWAKRAIVNGTRNVLTSTPITPLDLNQDNKISFNDTIIGLHQYISAINPITKNKVTSMFLNRIFNPENTTALLVNKKSMKSEYVDINTEVRDAWITDEGLDGVISKLAQEELRSEAIVVGSHYLMLIYDNGTEIELIYNTEQITEDMAKTHLRPITYAELFYLAVYEIRNKYPGFVTRYPVAGVGGIYPSNVYLRTTVNTRTVKLRSLGRELTVFEYPILKESYYNSLSVHPSHIVGLGADFDGDTVSFNILYEDESIKEIEDLLNSKEYYLSPDGRLLYSANTDTLSLVLKHMTS